MKEVRLTKRQIKKVADMWCGSMLVELDIAMSPEEIGFVDSESQQAIRTRCEAIGRKILNGKPHFPSITEIVDYILTTPNE